MHTKKLSESRIESNLEKRNARKRIKAETNLAAGTKKISKKGTQEKEQKRKRI
jgi:hypothetical protein